MHRKIAKQYAFHSQTRNLSFRDNASNKFVLVRGHGWVESAALAAAEGSCGERIALGAPYANRRQIASSNVASKHVAASVVREGNMSTPGVEPGLSRPQRDVLTTRRCGLEVWELGMPCSWRHNRYSIASKQSRISLTAAPGQTQHQPCDARKICSTGSQI